MRYIFILMLLVLVSCKKVVPIMSFQEVHELQLEISKGALDTSYVHIKKIDSVINLIDAPDSLRAQNNYLMGLHFLEKSRKDSATIYFHNATDFVRDSIRNEQEAEYFRSAWNSHYSQQLYGDCLTISQRFLSLLDPDKNFRAYSWGYHWDKTAYIAMGDYAKAQDVIDALIEITKEKDSANIPYALLSQSLFKYHSLKDKDGAMKILEEILENEDELSYNYKISINTNYGIYHYYSGNYRTALYHYLKALEASKKNRKNKDYLNRLVNSYSNIAEVQMDLKNYAAARKYLDSAKNVGIEKIAKEKQKAILDYELRLAMETNQGSNKIIDLVDKIYAHQDTTYNRKVQSELLELNLANEKEKVLLADRQAAELRNLKLETRIILVSSIGILSIAFGLLYYRQRRQKFKVEGLLMQQRLLRTQMNPHFTFNILSAIQNQIKTDKEGASQSILKFSRLLRTVLENSTTNYVKLEKELYAVRKYLDLQLLRFPNKFEYHIATEGMDEDEMIFIPPMIIQPFVENCIEHGFSGIKEKGRIDIDLKLKDKFIHCTIEDNGGGLNDSESILKKSTSIELISDYLIKVTKSQLTIIDKRDLSENTNGVIVKFLIPFKTTGHD